MHMHVFELLREVHEQVDLHELRTINADARTLAKDLGRAHDIIQNGLVNRCQSHAAGPDLQALAPKVLVQGGPVVNQDNVFLVELLLKFADEAPVDLTDGLPDTVRHVDGERNSVLELQVHSVGDHNVLHINLNVSGVAHLEVKEGLRNLLLQFFPRL